MEEQEFQKHVLKRIQKLERESFGATFEENYCPVKQEDPKQEIQTDDSVTKSE